MCMAQIYLDCLSIVLIDLVQYSVYGRNWAPGEIEFFSHIFIFIFSYC